MDGDNVWLQGREAETNSLRQIPLSIDDVSDTSRAVRGAGVNERSQQTSNHTREEDAR